MPVTTPVIPLAPVQYEQKYQDQLNRILAQYFNQNDNPGQVAGSAEKVGTTSVVAGMTFNRATPTVAAGSFVVGTQYRIATIGTTNFTLIGASANTVGITFTATGVGTGTGTANLVSGTAQTYSFATQADLANLRVGDVYVDTSASNVLKMKTS